MDEPYAEDGLVHFRSEDSTEFVAVAPEDVEKIIREGYVPASAKEVADRREFNKNNTLGASVAAGAEAAGAGFFDATLAIPKIATAGYSAVSGEEDPLADVTGRGTLENIAYLGAEATGGEGGVAARQYSEAARSRALANPKSQFAGNLVGGIAGSGLELGLGKAVGLGAKALGVGGRAGVAEMALTGAPAGAGAVAEDHFLQNKELTAESILAGAGLGMLLGGGMGIATAGAGRLVQGARSRLGARTAKEAAEPTVGRVVDGDVVIGDMILGGAAKEATTEKAVPTGFWNKARSVAEDFQAALAGTNEEGLDAIREMGPLQHGPKAKKLRSNLLDRQDIVNDAAIDASHAIDKVASNGRKVYEASYVRGPLRAKANQLISGNATEQLISARQQVGDVIRRMEESVPIRPRDRRSAEYRAWEEANDVYGSPKSREKAYKYLLRVQRKLDDPKADGVDAFLALNETKKTLQKEYLQIGIRKQPSQDDRIRATALKEFYENLQEPTRVMAESEELFGKLGDWQRRKNVLWKEYLETGDTFRDELLTRTQRYDYEGRPVYRADPAKMRSYLERMGANKADKALQKELIDRHMQAAKELADVIAEGGDEFQQQVTAIQKSYEEIGSKLGEAEETLGAINKVAALKEAEERSSDTLTTAGAILGGLPGAVVAKGVQMFGKPGQATWRLAQLERSTQRLHAQITGKTARVLEAATEEIPGRVAGAPAVKTKRVKFDPARLSETLTGIKPLGGVAARHATANFALQDETDQDAMRRYQRSMEQLVSNPDAIPRALSKSTGNLPYDAPQAFAATSVAVTRAVAYLKSKAPLPITSPELKRLGVGASPEEIARFKLVLQAVSDPTSVLDDLAEGKVNTDAIAAVRAVYPRLWESMASQIAGQVSAMDVPPPYDKRVLLDLFLGSNGAIEPSLSPELLRQRASYAEKQQPPVPPSRRSKPNVSKQVGTKTQNMTL